MRVTLQVDERSGLPFGLGGKQAMVQEDIRELVGENARQVVPL